MNSSRLLLNSTLVQRSLIRPAARRTALRPGLGLSSRRAPPQASLFLLYRPLSTETTSSTSPHPGPPPGFNLEEAKKPLPESSSTAKKEQPSKAEEAIKKGVNEASKEIGHAVAAGKEVVTGEAKKAEQSAVEKKDAKDSKEKKGIWVKVKHGVQHFWDGTKLLGTELKISWNLALKMAAGYELSRRERRQLERTVKDMGRLVPFSVFIIVPAGELFLPVALKLFPNMLPSTYEDQKQKDAKLDKLRGTRKDVSEFLKSTLQETGIPLSAKTRQREEFVEFFNKIKESGVPPTHEEIIKVCKIFKDDVTLDNLSRPQLVAMSRYMNLNSFGTDAILRYSIRHRMRQIKRDDKAISYEGIDSLTVPELHSACAARGIVTHGVSPARLREELGTWLELRLRHGIPSTLLVLSNAFMYGQGKGAQADDRSSQYDALLSVLSSIPEELYHEIELEVASGEGAATNKQRLEVLKEQQELIEEENLKGKGPKDDVDIDEDEKAKLKEAKEAEEKEAKQVGEKEAIKAVEEAERR